MWRFVDVCTPRMARPTRTPTEVPWLGAWAARLGSRHVYGCSARRHGRSPGLVSGEARLDRRLPRLHQVRRGVESVAMLRTLVLVGDSSVYATGRYRRRLRQMFTECLILFVPCYLTVFVASVLFSSTGLNWMYLPKCCALQQRT